MLRCKHSKYQGELKEKWNFADMGSYQHTEMENDAIKNLNDKWKANVNPKSEPTPETCTRPQAWVAFKKAGEEDGAWQTFIHSIVGTKAEEDFTSKDWFRVYTEAENPF
jgi:hypothetical protein